MDFINLFEKSKLNNIISLDISNNTISHAYMLCGQDELYLTYLATELSRRLLTNNHNENCNCSTCQKISSGVHSDVLTYPTGTSGIVVEDVNKIVEQSFIYPLEGDRKVFILKNFDVCTTQAQNKLLKTLEEPNNYVTFILTTCVPSAVLATIKSRTKLIDIEPVNNLEVKNFLSKNSELNKSQLDTFVYSSGGSLTRAIKIINDADFLKIKNLVLNTFVNMLSSSDVLKYSSSICSYKGKLSEILDEFNLIIRDLTLIKSNNEKSVLNTQNLEAYNKCNFSLKALSEICKLVMVSQNKLKANCNPNAVIDSLLLGMLEAKFKWK